MMEDVDSRIPEPDDLRAGDPRPGSAAAGELAAKHALLERHLPGLRLFVRRRIGALVRSKESSLDLAQSVCREALQDLDQVEYRGEASFRGWLHQRAEHKICDRARYWQRDRRDAERETVLDGSRQGLNAGLQFLATPSRDAVAKEDLERLEAAFLCLSAEQQEVIQLARFAGLVHEEVARRMGRTPSATRSLLCRALARLGTLLDGE